MKHGPKLIAKIVYWIVYVISIILPYKFLCVLFRFLGFTINLFGGYRRSVVIQNLTRSFPQKKYSEINKIADDFYHHFFSLFPQWIKSISESRESLAKRIEVVNLDLLDTDGNVYIMLGHYGNWEVGNFIADLTEKRFRAVYKQQSSAVADYFSNKMRAHSSKDKDIMVEMAEIGRYALQSTEPTKYFFVADQAPPLNTKKIINFLNQPTAAFEGVERLIRKTGGIPIYVEILPLKNRRHRMTFYQLDKGLGVTEGYFKCLEESIDRNPQFWLWSHKRWKQQIDVV